MLINVRGTNGSGKSTAVRHLLETYVKAEESNDRFFTNQIEQLGWRKNGPKVVGYQLPGDLIVAGRYEYHQMGGLDGFKYAPMWEELLPNFAKEAKFVVFESILISGNVGRAKDLASKFPCTFAFMDTTADECIRRIYARNGGAEFKEKLVRDTHNRMQVIKRNFTAQGELVTEIHNGEDLDALLRANGWDPSIGV